MSEGTSRRSFLVGCGTAALALRSTPGSATPSGLREAFPGLRSRDVYLDNAATTHRLQAVIDAEVAFYSQGNANPSRGAHRLAAQAYEQDERARARVAALIRARNPGEIVWTRGTTEAINLVATCWGARLRAGDELLLTRAEHYSNLLPWLAAAKRAGATVRFVDVADDGSLKPEAFERMLSKKTRLVAFTHVSNVLGIINPAAEICRVARRAGAAILLDAAQSAPHLELDVQALQADFVAFSSHKMLGPMGLGVLWARLELLEEMPPYQWGANMAHRVGPDGVCELASGGRKFGAGTPYAPGPIAFAAAVDFLMAHERRSVEQRLAARLINGLRSLPGLKVLGDAPTAERIPLATFRREGVDPEQLAHALDAKGIAVRSGELAALPLLRRFGWESAVRASALFYNTEEEIDRLLEALS